MVVPDDVRKCVVFVGYQLADGSFKFAGTAFFIGKRIPNTDEVVRYSVTAKHVIDGIRNLGLFDVFLRANVTGGGAEWIGTSLDEWKSHPTRSDVDVAVLQGPKRSDIDVLHIPEELLLTPGIRAEKNVGVGDEVFITGLFRHHHGSARNIPIVRIGNIAAMDEERVVTRAYGSINAYLLEARSIGGLSGSPVFVNLGATRLIEGKVTFHSGPLFYLIGMIHGHYDVDEEKVDRLVVEKNVAQINMGIAIVVPWHDIADVLSDPVFSEDFHLIALSARSRRELSHFGVKGTDPAKTAGKTWTQIDSSEVAGQTYIDVALSPEVLSTLPSGTALTVSEQDGEDPVTVAFDNLIKLS